MMDSPIPHTRYQEPHRLEDVLVLIQTLSMTTNTTGQILDSTLTGNIGLHPQSAPKTKSWVEVAKAHPEFFRVSGQGDDAIMLVCQYISKTRPSDEMLGNLMDIAVKTHDREVERRDKAQERKLESHKLGLTKLSLVLSAVTSVGSIIVAILALVAK